MSSPWSTPLWLAAEEPPQPVRSATTGYEPFLVEDEMNAVDLFLAEVLLPLLGEKVGADNRLQQRGMGDLVENLVAERILKASSGRNHLSASPAAGRKSMEDVRIDCGKACVYVDVKTRDIGNSFSMPNIASIDRLDRFYRKGTNVFVVLAAEYSKKNSGITIEDLKWFRIEEACWSCLSIQNLGKGQLQISDARRALAKHNGDRCSWMRRFHTEGAAFYGRLATRAVDDETKWLTKASRRDGSAE